MPVLLCLFLLLWGTHAGAAEADDETIIVHVFLNGSDAGSHFIRKTRDDFLVTRKLLQAVGVKDIPSAVNVKVPTSLNSLHAWLSYRLDQQTGDLLLSIQPTLLPVQEQSLLVKRQSHATEIKGNALFLNYGLNYTVNPGSNKTFTAPLELGLSVHGMSLINQMSYNKRLYRNKTQWSYDQRSHLQRWVVGDIQAVSDVGGASLAGIRVFRNFSMDQNLVTTPGVNTSIVLDTASNVEVFMDGASVYRGDFPAGVLNLKDIPFYRSGSITAELVVRDVFGREKRYNQLLYGSTGLLAKGLSEYDVSLGVLRSNTGLSNPTYGGKGMVYLRYRYGLSDWLTPSLGMESDGKYARISLGSSVLLGAYGQLDGLLATSRLAQGTGYFVRLNYNYTGSEFISPGIFFDTTSRAYGGLQDQPRDILAIHRNLGISLSTYMDGIGGLTGRWSASTNYARQMAQTGMVVLNTNLPGNVSLTTQLTRNWAVNQAPANQISASLGHSFSNGLYLSANYSNSASVDSFTVQLQWSPPLGEGFGFTENTSQQSRSQLSTNSRLQYRNQYADMSISAAAGQTRGPYQAQLNSALVWTEGRIHISRPVRDSFSLVRVNGIKDGMKVKIRNQYVGTTDSHGELLIPYMHAYVDDMITIRPEGLSFGYKIPKVSQSVRTGYRSGGLVEFNVVKLQVIEGTMFYQQGNELNPAAYSTIEFMQDGKKHSSVIGDDGALYLENLQPGSYTMTVYDDVHRCHVDVQIPSSSEMVNDLGRIICVVDQ